MSDTKPVIALTGATGFVGHDVLLKLSERGYRVKALVRPASRHKVQSIANVEWVEGQLGDAQSERSLTEGANIVLHMAGLITARSKAEYERVNSHAVGSLAAAAATAGVERFVYLSSLAARAPELSLYAWSKRQGEVSLEESFPTDKSVIVRAPAVFGAADKATAPIYACVRKGFLPSPGGRKWRERQLSLIHVNDLANFLVETCSSPKFNGQTLSPSTRAKISWPEFANACTEASGKPVKAMPIPLSLLYPVATVTTGVKALTGKGHLTLGKLREFLYDDWSVTGEFQSDTDLHLALKNTIDPVEQ